MFKLFIDGKRPPERTSWNKDLERWSLKTGISPKVNTKTPRKSIESWMLKSGIPEIDIYSRQGYESITSLRHYQSLSFRDYEMKDVKKRLSEWRVLIMARPKLKINVSEFETMYNDDGTKLSVLTAHFGVSVAIIQKVRVTLIFLTGEEKSV